MNILQQILNIFNNATHYKDLFQSGFNTGLTQRESIFVIALEESFLAENLKLRRIKDKSFVFMLNSSIGEIVAFPVTSEGFFFSRMRVYNKQDKSLGEKIDHHLAQDGEVRRPLDVEIQEMKNLFLSYSIDAQVYFK
ncbi:MAG: hypothetical protein ACD_80C00212G0009 [uncultured bacterium (gcode 4)]|uniref:Uncharacterized protein n=1 Tax=uncultured bacterium (gcode 4) TaxID=1234023 RepID=K1XGX8_9BACT|nr:MAG: hypothetical protein ACD_80C00212G0009 [uncultured bacterium (gcode 4)]HBB03623.1 hypothetical protein [Candidatus Gracilibacteria bacterium]